MPLWNLLEVLESHQEVMSIHTIFMPMQIGPPKFGKNTDTHIALAMYEILS